MNQQLASDFYPGWSRAAATPAVQQNVLRRLAQRLGFSVDTPLKVFDPDGDNQALPQLVDWDQIEAQRYAKAA